MKYLMWPFLPIIWAFKILFVMIGGVIAVSLGAIMFKLVIWIIVLGTFLAIAALTGRL